MNDRYHYKQLLIIGAGGHGKVIADIAACTKMYESISFLDDTGIAECLGYPVLGNTQDVSKYAKTHDIIVAIGNSQVRQKFIEQLEKVQIFIPILIHPQAIVASDVTIGAGTVVMAGAVINPGTTIGKAIIINTSSSIDHDCKIADYVHVSVGSHLAGTVQVGNHTWIGAGAVISNNICVCENCMLGAGTVVIQDIKQQGTYVGVPARKIKAIGDRV